jgi:hypothetical protein
MRRGQTHENTGQCKVDDHAVGEEILDTHEKSLDDRIVLLKLQRKRDFILSLIHGDREAQPRLKDPDCVCNVILERFIQGRLNDE